jgi:hypothetical protein
LILLEPEWLWMRVCFHSRKYASILINFDGPIFQEGW